MVNLMRRFFTMFECFVISIVIILVISVIITSLCRAKHASEHRECINHARLTKLHIDQLHNSHKNDACNRNHVETKADTMYELHGVGGNGHWFTEGPEH